MTHTVYEVHYLEAQEIPRTREWTHHDIGNRGEPEGLYEPGVMMSCIPGAYAATSSSTVRLATGSSRAR